MCRCFIKNKGLYIKLGQVISQLASIVPPAYVTTMEKCCADCPQSSMREVRRVVTQELGRPLEEVFADFDPKPVASASLAQVHRATLKSSGEQVAVKVQHKWVGENYPGDLKVIDFCIWLGEKIFPDFKYKVTVWLHN